jgi:hypothetical protein
MKTLHIQSKSPRWQDGISIFVSSIQKNARMVQKLVAQGYQGH